jgi:hypothetical protein
LPQVHPRRRSGASAVVVKARLRQLAHLGPYLGLYERLGRLCDDHKPTSGETERVASVPNVRYIGQGSAAKSLIKSGWYAQATTVSGTEMAISFQLTW